VTDRVARREIERTSLPQPGARQSTSSTSYLTGGNWNWRGEGKVGRLVAVNANGCLAGRTGFHAERRRRGTRR